MWASGICETTRRQWRVRGQTNLVPRVFSFFPLAILENDKTLEKGQSADHFKTISTNEHRKWCSVLSALFSQSSDMWCCIVCAKAAKHLKGVALTSLNRSNFIVNFLLFSGYICWSVRITKKGGGISLFTWCHDQPFLGSMNCDVLLKLICESWLKCTPWNTNSPNPWYCTRTLRINWKRKVLIWPNDLIWWRFNFTFESFDVTSHLRPTYS